MDRHPRGPVVLLALAGLTIVGSAGLVGYRRLEARFERIDEADLRRARSYDDFDARLETVRTSLLALQEDLQGALRSEETRRGSLEDDLATAEERLASTEGRLGTIGHAIEAQASTLARLEEAHAEVVPTLQAELLAELDARDRRLDRRWESLHELASSARQTADDNQRRVERIAAPRDLHRMWREIVGPVVQISGETSVGSGVLLPSRPAPGGAGFQTYVLTAWHVVRDIQVDANHREDPVDVAIYDEDGGVRRERADLLVFEPDLDAALLSLHTPDDLRHGAILATPQRLANVRIFDGVYAVGCPLGNDPIPTRGEVASNHHAVDGEHYWMINAPTYIGNSGGGIFDGETHALLGIFSKIYTHGTLRPTIVPHMGLVTPLGAIYDWLEEVGYGDLIAGRPDAHLASAER